jgi:hypothetical protein
MRYLKDLQDTNAPLKQMCGFTRVFIPAGQTKMVDVPMMNQGLRTYNPENPKDGSQARTLQTSLWIVF